MFIVWADSLVHDQDVVCPIVPSECDPIVAVDKEVMFMIHWVGQFQFLVRQAMRFRLEEGDRRILEPTGRQEREDSWARYGGISMIQRSLLAFLPATGHISTVDLQTEIVQPQ